MYLSHHLLLEHSVPELDKFFFLKSWQYRCWICYGHIT